MNVEKILVVDDDLNICELLRLYLTKEGYNVVTVKEQMIPDPFFSTLKSPNPEESSAFEYAIKLGKEEKADILIATDPDADRMGTSLSLYS